MDDERARVALIKEPIPALMLIDSKESAQEFSIRAAESMRVYMKSTPDLSVDFIIQFLRAATHGAMAQMGLEGKRAAELEADLTAVELNGQLMAARAANDIDAERELFEEGRRRERTIQEKIDAEVQRVSAINDFRMSGIDALVSDLGFNT